MSNKTFLPLPTGNSGFTQIRAKNRYYVDKTPYLKNVFSEDVPAEGSLAPEGSSVLLFTRPRRFGKTLLMDMFESFLKVNVKNPDDTSLQEELFKGLKILEDKDFCKKYMGRFPVIFITLKDVHGTTFKAAYSKLAELVASKALEYSFLKDSPNLDDKEKAKFDLLTDEIYLKKGDDEAQSYVTSAIKDLASMLYKHFNRQVYILIDEYDVPLAKAHEAHKKDFHKKMVSLVSSFLGFLKDPQKDPETGLPKIGKVVITGCLKVAKNSIFTGVNNLKVNTVVSKIDEYTGMIGFTKEETLKALKDYEMDEYAEVVKNNYDGYRFYDKEIFCPWDVINFIDENYKNNLKVPKETAVPGNYWANSTSSPAVYEYLGYLTDNDTQKMQNLVDGKSISFRLNESMNYDCLSAHKSDDFWSLLLHTGYLTLDWDKTQRAELSKDSTSNKDIFARIPNLEIKECFTDNIKDRFSDEFKKKDLPYRFVTAMVNGNSKGISDILFDMLQKYVSIRDTATKAPLENFYHGFINGIFTGCEGIISEYHSNYESGDGYADITFKTDRNTKAVVIEIKATSKDEEMDELSAAALSQIEKKNYAGPFIKLSKITDVYAYGIVFCRKDCIVNCRKLK